LEYYIGQTGRGGRLGKVGRFSASPFAALPNGVLTAGAAKHLQKMASLEPQLSSDARIAEVTERALAAVDAFVRGRVAAA
ncbi:MAG: pyruvyl transferase, partial [Devosia nanyangense]|nr:pyruvyl transferase [Devosia nanyangense]